MRTVLPIPFEARGSRYVAALYRAPSAGTLADTRKVAEQGARFGAFNTLVQGVVDGFEDDAGEVLEEKAVIRGLCKLLPYRSAEVVAMKALVSIAEDDGIEGYYRCPRCGRELICEREVDADGELIVDTRDFLTQLPLIEATNGVAETLELTDPVELKVRTSEEETTETVLSLAIRHPSMADCMAAERRSPAKDPVRLQLAIYVEATEEMNGDPVDNRWKNAVGKPIYERVSGRDMRALAQIMDRYGLDTRVDKACGNCGKEWQETLDLSSFFAYALRVE